MGLKKSVALGLFIGGLLVVLNLNGQIMINNSSDISINGACALVLQSISVQNDGGIHDNATSLFEFTGISAQLSGSSAMFYKLTINNSGGITLLNPVTITNAITFSNGILSTFNNNELIINNGVTLTSVSDNSHVFGPVKKIGDEDFTFPVGDANYYRPISISGLASSDTYTAEFIHTNPNADGFDNTALAVGINNVSQTEYWVLSRAGAVDAFVTLHWDNKTSGTITDYLELLVCHWNTASWDLLANSGPSGNNNAGSVTTTSKVSSFSPFTLGSSTIDNPLPIELVNFRASNANELNILQWETSSEQNNEYFQIEKSKNGLNFYSIGKVAGAGNSNRVIAYAHYDSHPEGLNYYRIKQMDYDGNYTYSKVVSLEHVYNVQFSYSIVNAGLTYILNDPNGKYTIQLINSMGQMIQIHNLHSTHATIPLHDLKPGLYIIRLVKDHGLLSIKKHIF